MNPFDEMVVELVENKKENVGDLAEYVSFNNLKPDDKADDQLPISSRMRKFFFQLRKLAGRQSPTFVFKKRCSGNFTQGLSVCC